MIKEDYLTVRWNNILTFGLGIIMLVYVAFVLTTSALSDFIAFIGLAMIAVVY